MTARALTVRLDQDQLNRVERIAKANGIGLLDALRICIAKGLPSVERGEVAAVTESHVEQPEKVAA